MSQGTYIRTPQLRAIMSERFKGIPSPRKGVKLSESTKKKISEGNKGKIRTPEAIEQLRISNLGRKHTPEAKAKIGLKGDKNPMWKGGITPLHRRIRNSTEYKLWRHSVFERDKFTCVFCFTIGGLLNADHIKPFALYPELRFAIDNGRTLCVSCHRKTPTYGKHLIQ